MKKNVLLVCIILVFCSVLTIFTLAANSDNNLAAGKTAYASGTEIDNDSRFAPSNVTDGSTSTRWSSNRSLPSTPVWLYVDLGKSSTIGEIVIRWEAANAKDYDIEISNDAKTWTLLKSFKKDTLTAEPYNEVYQLPTVKTARYVRVYIKGGNGYAHVSIFEIEVYAQKNNTNVLDQLKSVNPTISSDGKKVILPKSPDSKYEIKLYGTSHPQVIDLDGNIYQPLTDVTVDLMYKAVKKGDPNTIVQKGDYNIKLKIPGKYKTENTDNTKPDVLPALREWKGNQGSFKVTNGSKIIVDNTNANVINKLNDKALLVKDYIADMTGLNLEVIKGDRATSGNIFITLTGDFNELGKEGYYIEISDKVIITAADEIGAFYGGISITQMLSTSHSLPCGIIRDYPSYSIRSGMLDVARAWIPLEHVEEITRYFAYYKLNEIHLHINDRGENNYAAFRLESNVKGLTSTDGYYTKAAYRQYQKDMQKLGITVITEIDTPAHSYAFSKITPSVPMMDENHLDITKPETLEFVKKLFDEYMTGDDPVFVSKKVHIGTDEFPAGYNEQMRAYTDALIKHANSRGYKPRFWGSFGKQGFNGSTPVSGDAEANYWATELSDYKTLYDYGYDIINTCGPVLYVVPGGNYGFADYLDIKSLYKAWSVNDFILGGWTMPNGHPQTVGAGFALWNDIYTGNGGFSPFDIFDRTKTAVALISEKTWCGEQTKSISPDDFMRRVILFSNKAPLTNPGRYYKGDDKSIVKLEEIDKSIGFPYTVDFKVDLPKSLDKEIILFDGTDGQLVVNINKSGKLGFRRGVYTFIFDYKLPLGKQINLTLTGDNKQTILIVNDTFFYTAINQKTNVNKQFSSTFVLPVETIADIVSDIKIKSQSIDLNALKANNNLALKKPTTVSGLEVSDGRFTSELAVDGDEGTRLSFARDKDEQWLIIDLEQIRAVNKIEILFHEHVPEYKIFVSETKDNWKEVYHLKNGEEGTKKLDVIEFELTQARYIKYQQLKRHYVAAFSTYFSGGILEFRVTGFDTKKYNTVIEKAEQLIGKSENQESIADIRTTVLELKKYLKSNDIFLPHADGLMTKLEQLMIDYSKPSVSEVESKSVIEIIPSKSWLWYGISLIAAIIIAVISIIIVKKRKK